MLRDMFEPDGYSVVVHEWPAGGTGRARLEVVAGDGACADCIVPKSIMRMVLMDQLPAGVVVEESDLIYPADRQA